MTVNELKELCRQSGLKVSERKAELIDRLVANSRTVEVDDIVENMSKVNLNEKNYSALPVELKEEILKNVENFEDLFKICKTDKTNYEICKSRKMFKKLIQRQFFDVDLVKDRADELVDILLDILSQWDITTFKNKIRITKSLRYINSSIPNIKNTPIEFVFVFSFLEIGSIRIPEAEMPINIQLKHKETNNSIKLNISTEDDVSTYMFSGEGDNSINMDLINKIVSFAYMGGENMFEYYKNGNLINSWE